MSVSSLINQNNNVVVAGVFQDASFNVYNNNGTVFTVLENTFQYTTSHFIIYYDETGKVLWANRITPIVEYGYMEFPLISLDAQKNVYLLCSYYDNIQIYNADNTLYGVATIENNYRNYRLIKYSAGIGSVIWTATINGLDYSELDKITIDPFNHIFIVGQFYTDFFIYNANGTLFQSITNPTTYNKYGFILQYNSNGEAQWLNKLNGGSSSDVVCKDVSTDLQGNVYVNGYFDAGGFNVLNLNGTVFAVLTGTTNRFQSYYIHNQFIIKYDALGNPLWATKLEANICFIKVDLKNNIYITGENRDDLKIYNLNGSLFISIPSVTNASQGSAYVAKYDTSGNPLWATKLINSSPINNQYLNISCIAVDYNETIYISGISLYNQLNVYNAAGNLDFSLSSYQNKNFIIQYDTSGNALQYITTSVFSNTVFLALTTNVDLYSFYYKQLIDVIPNIPDIQYDGTVLVKYNTKAAQITPVWANKVILNNTYSNAVATSSYILPLPPTDLVVLQNNVVGGSLLISWTPYPNQIVKRYTISAYLNSEIYSSNTVGGNLSQYNYTHLRGGEYYTFTITAVNLIGTGTPSVFSFPAVLVKSVPDAPLLVAVSPTQMENTASIAWSASFDGASPILGYFVSLSSLKTTIARITTTNLYAEINGLDAGFANNVAYYFTVIAFNSYGNSAALISPFIYPFQRVIQNPVIYKKFNTGGNDPNISKAMRYSQYIGRR